MKINNLIITIILIFFVIFFINFDNKEHFNLDIWKSNECKKCIDNPASCINSNNDDDKFYSTYCFSHRNNNIVIKNIKEMFLLDINKIDEPLDSHTILENDNHTPENINFQYFFKMGIYENNTSEIIYNIEQPTENIIFGFYFKIENPYQLEDKIFIQIHISNKIYKIKLTIDGLGTQYLVIEGVDVKFKLKKNIYNFLLFETNNNEHKFFINNMVYNKNFNYNNNKGSLSKIVINIPPQSTNSNKDILDIGNIIYNKYKNHKDLINSDSKVNSINYKPFMIKCDEFEKILKDRISNIDTDISNQYDNFTDCIKECEKTCDILTCQNLCLKCNNNNKVCPWTNYIKESTVLNKPGKPNIEGFVKNNKIEIQWPISEKEKILYYLIIINSINSDNSISDSNVERINLFLPNHETQIQKYTIHGLDYTKSYNINIIARNQQGFSDKSESYVTNKIQKTTELDTLDRSLKLLDNLELDTNNPVKKEQCGTERFDYKDTLEKNYNDNILNLININEIDILKNIN